MKLDRKTIGIRHDEKVLMIFGRLLFQKALLVVLLILGTPVVPLMADDYDEAPIWYSSKEAPNELHSLMEEAAKEGGVWTRNPLLFLEELLLRLEISKHSQVLVMSKTSLQKNLIAPTSPRALYFNENHYVGYVPGGEIEVMFADGEKGTLFYRIAPPIAGRLPILKRDSSCLSCHTGSRTKGVPGFLMRSVTIDRSGTELANSPALSVSAKTPFSKRWAGWFVTGMKQEFAHRGNQFKGEQEGGTLANASDLVDFSRYMTDTSDALPLTLLSHQVDWHNEVTKGAYDFRRAQWFFEKLSPGRDPLAKGTSVSRVLETTSEVILENLLFYDEAILPGEGIFSDEKVRKDWLAQKKTDQAGHSLRDLRLYKRLFKYRCSYMIYSDSFKALPPELHDHVLEKLWKILKRERDDDKYDYLGNRERKRIFSILLATYEELPEIWARAEEGP